MSHVRGALRLGGSLALPVFDNAFRLTKLNMDLMSALRLGGSLALPVFDNAFRLAY